MIDLGMFAGDPPVPVDGSCYVCGKPRRPERSRRYAGDIAKYDSFCSNLCARAFHGNPIPEHSIWSKPGRDRKFEAA